METISPSPNLFERLNNWIKQSVTIKLMSIGFLILILMIPSTWIESLIAERQSRAESVVKEISEKWSGEQTVSGPVLIIPFTKREKIDKGKDGVEIKEWMETAYFLPNNLNVQSKVNSEVLHRGIFEAAVYQSDINMQSQFDKPDFAKLNVDEKDVRWKEARLVLGINDLRGISKNPVITCGGVEKTSEPSNQIGLSTQFNKSPNDTYEGEQAVVAYAQLFTTENGVVVPLQWTTAEDFKKDVSITLGLKGSTLLYFVPVGKTTHVKVEGAWSSPSFTGNFSP